MHQPPCYILILISCKIQEDDCSNHCDDEYWSRHKHESLNRSPTIPKYNGRSRDLQTDFNFSHRTFINEAGIVEIATINQHCDWFGEINCCFNLVVLAIITSGKQLLGFRAYENINFLCAYNFFKVVHRHADQR